MSNNKKYSAQFRVLLNDRYGRPDGFWGAKYRIINLDDGSILVSDKITDKKGFTLFINSVKPMKFRLELENLSKGKNIYEIPTFKVNDSEVLTTDKIELKTVLVEKGYLRVLFKDPFGNLLNKEKFSYRFSSKLVNDNSNTILSDWQNLVELGYTDTFSTEKGFLISSNKNSKINEFRQIILNRPYIDVELQHKETKVSTKFEARVIPYGSDKRYRSIEIDKHALAAITKPKDEKSVGLVDELKFARNIRIKIARFKGQTIIARRADNGKLFDSSLKEKNAINWQDGQEVTFKVPARYKGNLVITLQKNGKIIGNLNIGALDTRVYKSNEIPEELKMVQEPLAVKESPEPKISPTEYALYCINLSLTGVSKKTYNLDDIKDPKKCSDKELKAIVNGIMSSFWFDAGFWPIFSTITISAPIDLAQRVKFVENGLKPFFKMAGVIASEAKFVIKQLSNKTTAMFFMGLVSLQSHFNYTKMKNASKQILNSVIEKSVRPKVTMGGVLKGSIVGFVIGAVAETVEWWSQEDSQKDITDLMSAILGVAVKAIVCSLMVSLVASLIAGPVGVVLAIGIVVGLIVSIFLEWLDAKFSLTANLKSFVNHIQDTIATTLTNAVNVSNRLFGTSITLPSWIYN
ncbi:hypothetical protein G9F32_11530 [Acinetobacter sp. 194]|uniref:hypothetical protein n=1 Tax=Acinetobacter shaoyimingii TaxID=2715164 RepID=UPI001409B143|nr:hypothetical protein [Acinetobacter shaoyimingii]NHB58640.1 hypothetical protein [Acinetobacter shaoyimingii]